MKENEIKYLLKYSDQKLYYKNKILDLLFGIFCFLVVVHLLSGPFMVIKEIDLYPIIMKINLFISVLIFINNIKYLNKEKIEINNNLNNLYSKYHLNKEILIKTSKSFLEQLKEKNIKINELKKEEIEKLYENILNEYKKYAIKED